MPSRSKNDLWNLESFGQALDRSARERDERRKTFSDGLEKRTPLYVERDETNPDWRWTAWFLSEDKQHFMAFEHYANGYLDRPSQVFDVVLFRALMEHVK